MLNFRAHAHLFPLILPTKLIPVQIGLQITSCLPIENGCHGSGQRLVNEAMDRIFAGEIHTIMEAFLLYSPSKCLFTKFISASAA